MMMVAAVTARSTAARRRVAPSSRRRGTRRHHMLSGAATRGDRGRCAPPAPPPARSETRGVRSRSSVITGRTCSRVIEAGELAQVIGDAVGLAGSRRSRHEARILKQALDDGLLLGKREGTEVDLVPRRHGDLLLGGGAEEAGHARVRVLDIEDGIVRRLSRGHREVEVELAVVAAGEEGEARGVPSHLLEQLLHEHELTAALGHAHGLSVAQQGHQLHAASRRSAPGGGRELPWPPACAGCSRGDRGRGN